MGDITVIHKAPSIGQLPLVHWITSAPMNSLRWSSCPKGWHPLPPEGVLMSTAENNVQVSTNRKAAGYVRVSTNLQMGGMESQTRALNEFFHRNGITDYEIFTDEGISGTKISRPSLDRMMSAVRSGTISQVVCWSFSRFARSTTHLLSGLEEMKKHNCRFLSISEALDTESPLGRAMFTLTGKSLPTDFTSGKTPKFVTFGLYFGGDSDRPLALIDDSKSF